MKQRKIDYLLCILLAVLGIGAAIWLFLQFQAKEAIKIEFRALSQATVIQTPAENPSSAMDESPTASILAESSGELTGSFEGSLFAVPAETSHDLPLLRERNPDCIGWVRVPGTGIDYPLMWTPEEPKKYLHLSYWDEYSDYGVPFLDARCTQESGNLIIYGHNMADGTMFTPVLDFTEPEVLASHCTIQVEIGGETRTYRAFAAAHTTSDSPIFRYIHLATPEAVADFLTAVQTECGQGLDPGEGTEFVTLVTCDMSRENGRAVVIGGRTS